MTHEGFRKESRTVNVLLGPPVSVNVGLEIANASTTVTVTEEARTIFSYRRAVVHLPKRRAKEISPVPGWPLILLGQFIANQEV